MFNNTAIVDRLRMVRWSNHSHPTGVVTGFRARIKLKRLSFNLWISNFEGKNSNFKDYPLNFKLIYSLEIVQTLRYLRKAPQTCFDDFETNF